MALTSACAGQTVDLTTPTTVIAAAGLSTAAAAAVTDIAHATNAAVATQLAAAGDPLATFNAITGGSIALQGNAATALQAAAQPGSTQTFAGVDASFTANLGATLAADDTMAAQNDSAPCYCPGTLIETDGGPVAIEKLAIGDRVMTIAGIARPIKWIGHRRLDCARHPRPHDVWPVRVAADAFGPGLPRRPLWLSPGHAVFIDGALIPIIHLANGATIVQVRVESVTYLHVELESHDVIIAEGLPAETYLDTGNRMAFVNNGGFVELHPDFAPKHWTETFAPLHTSGPIVASVKQQVLARARGLGHRITTDPDLHLLTNGRIVNARHNSGNRYKFYLPITCRDLYLVSRRWVPAHHVPESRDVRELGVCVRRIVLDGAVLPLADLSDGWHDLEETAGDRHRWTQGKARLPDGAATLTLDIRGARNYWRGQDIGRHAVNEYRRSNPA